MKPSRRQVWLFSSGIVIGAVLIASMQARRGAAEPARPLADRARAESTFEDQGTTYVLIAGNLYRVDEWRGELAYVDQLYDKDFFTKNYAVENGRTFRKDDTGRLIPTRRAFTEGFEDAATLGELVAAKPDDVLSGKRFWTHVTLQSPRAPTIEAYNKLARRILKEGGDFLDNRVEPSAEVVHAGKRALKCVCAAKTSSMITAKASLSSSLLYFKQGDDFWFTGWFYVVGPTRPFTLMDLESTWIKQHPGLRIMLREDGCLAAELKWARKPMYRQPKGSETTFPVDRWTQVKLHLRLSAANDGVVELWQDDRHLLQATGQTLPLPTTVYDNLEVGISAHSFGSDAATLFVDDIEVADQRK